MRDNIRQSPFKEAVVSAAPKLVLTLVLLALLATSNAQAQDDSRRLELFVEGGPSFYTSKSEPTLFVSPSLPSPVDAVSRSSLGISGRLFTGGRLYLTPKDSLEASYAFSANRLRTTISATAPGSGTLFFLSDSMRIHQLQFNYVRRLVERGRFQAFATGGLGVVDYSAFGDDDVKFAGNFGGGADIRLHERVSLRVQFQDVVARLPALAFEKGTTHNLVPSAGFAFRF